LGKFHQLFPANTTHYIPDTLLKSSSEEFDKTLQNFKEIISDFTRLSAVKHFHLQQQTNLPTGRNLMLQFSFDKERLNLAQFAYLYVSDPGNYNLLAKNFIFNGSAQQLWNYLGIFYNY
jgi:hypothetical protein